MSESIQIRQFAPSDQEYAAVAGIAAVFDPDLLGDYEYAQAVRLRALDESFAGGEHALWRYVAEAGGAIAGYAQLFHIPWLREPGRYWVAIRVHPAQMRRGIGRRLYAQALGDLRQLGAIAAWVEVHERMPAIVAYVERLGFRELFRSWPFWLDTRGFDLTRLQGALDRLAARGIAITTLARERQRDPECLSKLYDLHVAITRDIPIPGQPHPAPGLGWFEQYALVAPLALPDAYFIAADGERYVGESFLQRVEGAPAELSQRVTGVHSDYRGYGIAMALKLQTIAYAQQHGYTRIWTGVESNNPSMLAINARLGFTQGLGVIVFEKELLSRLRGAIDDQRPQTDRRRRLRRDRAALPGLERAGPVAGAHGAPAPAARPAAARRRGARARLRRGRAGHTGAGRALPRNWRGYLGRADRAGRAPCA